MSTDSEESASDDYLERPQRDHIIATMGGRSVLVNLQSDFVLADRIHEMIKAEIGWIESFTKHGAAKGTHFEAIIRDIIAEQLPSPFAVSTGYIIESRTKKCSNQIDVIVYDTSVARPLFERREFVIVDSSTVRFTCEIKSTLKKDELRKWLACTIRSNLGHKFGVSPGFQDAHLFAFSSRMSTQKIMQVVEEVYAEFFEQHTEYTESQNYASFLERMGIPAIIIRDRAEYIVCDLRSDNHDGKYKIYLNHYRAFAKHGTGALLSSVRFGTQSDRFSDPNFCDFTTTSARHVISKKAISRSFAAKYFVSNHELASKFKDGHDVICKLQKHFGKGIAGVYVPVLWNFEELASVNEVLFSPLVKLSFFVLEDGTKSS